MGQFSAEKPVAPGSALSGNQHEEEGSSAKVITHNCCFIGCVLPNFVKFLGKLLQITRK